LLRYHLTFPKRVFESLWCCLPPKCGFIIFLEFWNVDLQNVADFYLTARNGDWISHNLMLQILPQPNTQTFCYEQQVSV
jgi:hypothetical protein